MNRLNKNQGMFLETIIKNSLLEYTKREQAWFRKQEVPIKILKKQDDFIYGKILEKANVDFYGCYQGKFFCIEAKQTNDDKFYTNHLKTHQIDFLNLISFLKGHSILILYFNKFNTLLKVQWNHYIYFNFVLKISLKYEWFLKNGRILDIIFPGWIDFLK